MWIPGFSTAGAIRASNSASSGTRGLNLIGLTVCSGGKYAIDILGACPSSRRRLAQKAVVIISSIVGASGFGASPILSGAAEIRAWSRFATILAAGYDGPPISVGSIVHSVNLHIMSKRPNMDLAFDRLDGARPRQAIAFLHGILGRGINLRMIAKRFVEALPEWAAWLVDLRGHGRSPK